MRVLVTGASGFVGRHLVGVLATAGAEVVAWGLATSPDRQQLGVDLLDAGEVRAQDLRAIDAVIHLAGLANVSASFSDPVGYVTANPTIQTNLMEALLAQRSFPRVLIVSSGSVYGSQDAVLTEASQPEPADPYAISKVTQELLGWYYARRGFEVIVARPFNHIGPGQQPGYLVPDIASQIAALERAGAGEITTGRLTAHRDYTDVRDVAAAYEALVRNGRPQEIYNVCSGHSQSAATIVAKLSAMSTATITVVTDPGRLRPTDATTIRASNAKLRDETGWTPKISLDETLADVLGEWRAIVAATGTPEDA